MRLRRLSRRRRAPRVLALIPFRDEMRFLPGFFQNVAPHVDGVIALDDQSSDESAAFAARQSLRGRAAAQPAQVAGRK